MDSAESEFRRAIDRRPIVKALGVAALTFFFGLFSYPPLSAQPIINPAQTWGPTNNGMCMALSAVRTVNTSWHDVEFDLAFRNAGTTDFFLNLGFTLNNGKQQHPDAIQITLTDSKGRAREFDYSSGLGGIGGRIDDLLVAFPSGATYVMRFNLERFCCRAQQVTLKAGRYRLSAHIKGRGARSLNSDTPGIALLNFWKGLARSNSVEFEVSQ